ncbi:unnamed protein product [Caenorhabditis nigoni]
MSGGQKQRIASALVRNPRALILDEATMALNVESEALVQQALSRCAQEMNVLVISHRLSIVRNFNNVAVIEHGETASCWTQSHSATQFLERGKKKNHAGGFRLHNWIQLPEKERLDIVNWVLPRKRARQSMRLLKPKKRTTKFTEVQKKTLNAIFEVTEKPPLSNYFNRNRQRQLDLQRQQM